MGPTNHIDPTEEMDPTDEMDPKDRATPTRAKWIAEACARLQGCGIENPRRDAEWLMEDVLNVDRLHILTRPDERITDTELDLLDEYLLRREKREPIQYITGKGYFYGREFKVSPGVLIPRPETELLVEWAIQEVRAGNRERVLDLGTGSGCILISIDLEVGGLSCAGADVSEEALRVARSNAERLGARVKMLQVDILSAGALEKLPGRIDVLVSNPPYIPSSERESLDPEVRDFEPEGALFVGRDPLLYYRAISLLAPSLLVPGGVLGVEVHADHGREVAALFTDTGFHDVKIKQDLAGRNRLVSARH